MMEQSFRGTALLLLRSNKLDIIVEKKGEKTNTHTQSITNSASGKEIFSKIVLQIRACQENSILKSTQLWLCGRY